jgi:hypothetical protein
MDTTDRELLELAAKAAGYIEFTWGEVAGPRARKPNGVAGPWNPLTDDGDALRLAVQLEIRPDVGERMVVAEWWVRPDLLKQGVEVVLVDGDKYAATRRAIVRAAAEIGRAMPLA